MQHIRIPEPCSEDWNKMTPKENGAFCQKCALDVYDFTNKTGDEIRQILSLNLRSRLCGRIEPQQLVELNHDFVEWKLNNQRSFQRAWIFTLFVVFGMSLFSCTEDQEPVLNQYQKAAKAILTTNQDANSPKIDSTAIEAKVVKPTIAPLANSIVPKHKRVRWTAEIECILPEVAVLGESIQRIDDVYRPGELGGLDMSIDYQDYLKGNSDVFGEKSAISVMMHPNPAINEATLKINIPKRGKGEIELLASIGQKIKTIHSGRLQKGETTFNLDITDLKTGNYLVVIYVDGKKESVQFSKL